MRNLLKRSYIIFLTLAFFISPVSNFLSTKVKADNIWLEYTDSNFSDNNSVIFQLIGFSGGIIWGTRDHVFISGMGGAQQIDGPIFDGTDVRLINLVFTGDHLYALTVDDSSTYKFWTSPEAGEWFDSSTVFDDIPNFTSAPFMGVVGNALTFEIITNDGETLANTIYLLSGESLIPITDETTFVSMNIPPEYLYVVKVIDYLDGSAMYLIENLQNGNYFLYRYTGEIFEAFHSFGNGYFVSDIATFNNTVYVYADINNSNPLIEYYDGLGFSSPSDTFDQAEFSGKFLVTEGNLYIGTTRYDAGNSRIFLLNTENNFSLLQDHVGDPSLDGNTANSYITGMTGVGPFLVVAAAYEGEGPYHPSIWLYGPGQDTPVDGDSDGINDDVEAQGPNSGDANNDNVTDATQNNVASFVNTITNTYSVLDSGYCDIDSVNLDAESVNTTQDSGFSYPVGMMNFHLVCANNADPKAPTITQYFYGDYNPELFVLRKYNSNTNSYVTVNSATITRVNVGGLPALKVSYVVEDGGPLDMDGTVNNEITDPSGPALNSVLVPNTGIGGLY